MSEDDRPPWDGGTDTTIKGGRYPVGTEPPIAPWAPPTRPDGTPDDAIQYIGHHFSADAPWMDYWLGLETYRRCSLDTEFAQQCIDETSELDLERGIAMKYTQMGYYSQDLIEWKREHKKLCEDGYGYIPSEIIVPYAARDVLAPYQAYPRIRKQLEGQQLTKYYDEILNPFVCDVLTNFVMEGLPMDRKQMDEMRELFHFARRHLEVSLKRRIYSEARAGVLSHLMDELGDEVGLACAMQVLSAHSEAEAMEIIKADVKLEDVPKWIKRIAHLFGAADFNIRSPDMLRRWLFDVEGLTPIKSTNQKAKGLPSMAWDKVTELPADRQKMFTPAVDKQTIQILSEQMKTLDELLNLNAVGNVCKAFLKEAEIVKKAKPKKKKDIDLPDEPDELAEDSLAYEYSGLDEEDEVEMKENGLHAWLSSEDKVLGMYSLTETGRPRSWRPNTLNWPSYVNARIGKSVVKAVREANEEGSLPESLVKWLLVDDKHLPSIRSCVCAPPGYVLIESDYCAAEMFGLGTISGDDKFVHILTQPDPEWACLVPKHPFGKFVRVAFSPTSETGIPEKLQEDKYLMAVWKDGKFVGKVTEADLARNEDGTVKHRGYDIHWQVVERTYERPRESMVEKIHRNAGKVLNFSSAYGASPSSLERKIESDTGVRPEPGTGQKGLDAIAARQPRATQFLEEMAMVPKTVGYYRCASGRIRHCVLHGAGADVSWRVRQSQESALGREMRNAPMQESVGSTSARACVWALKIYRVLGLKARPMTCLYDSLVTICPLEERFVVSRIHHVVMSEINTWSYNDAYGQRTLQYNIDNDINYRWSTKPSEAEAEQLADTAWHPTPDRLKWILEFENWGAVVS